jgi:O-antigen ligase
MGESLSVGSLLKPGDVSVHLAGIASFMLLGLHQFRARDKGRAWIKEWLLWPIWMANFLLFGSQNRGGLLSIMIALTVVLLLWNRGGWGKLAMVCLCILSVFVFWELEVDVGATRNVSPEQILVNLWSITGDAGPVNEGTRQWRLSWWRRIRDYTVYGDFFWGGKGFGLNLADDDGFQTDAAHSLRSPHNGHLTILARAGAPGFALWILLQGSLWLGLLQRYLRARRAGQMERAAFIVWILAYIAALTVNSAFDVYLEGPQGGIWFWTVFGVGLSIVAEPAPRPYAAAVRSTAFVQRVMPARAV